MRVTGGRLAERKLTSPSGRVRPSSEEVRVEVGRLLRKDMADARVLDLFAGCGALGIELLSHGARSCDFVENSPEALHALKANVTGLRLKSATRIFKRDAIQFVERIDKQAYDIAVADPPYGSKKLDRIVQNWIRQPFSRILVLEHDLDHVIAVSGRQQAVERSMVTVLRT